MIKGLKLASQQIQLNGKGSRFDPQLYAMLTLSHEQIFTLSPPKERVPCLFCPFFYGNIRSSTLIKEGGSLYITQNQLKTQRKKYMPINLDQAGLYTEGQHELEICPHQRRPGHFGRSRGSAPSTGTDNINRHGCRLPALGIFYSI